MKKINTLKTFALGALVLATGFAATNATAQSWQRVYANGQTNNDVPFALFVSVTDSLNAVGSSLTTYSNLSFTAAGVVTQRLTFPESPGTNPIHVKIGKGATILDLLPTITVTAYNGSTAVGSQTIGSLLGALKGESQADIVVNPTSAATSVEVSYSGISIGEGVRVYAAYFDKPSSVDTMYNKPLDVLSSSNGALGAGVLSSVTAPLDAIDGNEATFASINKLADVLNSNYLTALFSSKSASGDSVRLLLNNPGSLLTLDLLSSGLSVSTFNGATETNIFSDASLLNLRLLPGSTDKYILSIPTTNQFDRIRVGTGGTLSTTYGLNVYEIGRKIPAVSFAQDTVIYDGTILPTLTAELPNTTDTVVWYESDSPIGAPLATGFTYTLLAAPTASRNYYAFVKRNGTIQAASVGVIYVQVKTIFAKPIVMLEGAYRSDSLKMTTRLSTSGYLPISSGSATRSDINTLVVDGQAVVDWVTVELRDTTSSRTLLESQPGILFSDGRVLPPATLDSFLFKQLAGTYHLVVRHRNHLGAATKVALNATPTTVDFTSGTTTTSTQAVKDSKKMLHSGNFNNDNAIAAGDFSLIRPLVLVGAFGGYYVADINFSGSVTAVDFSLFRGKFLLGPSLSYSDL